MALIEIADLSALGYSKVGPEDPSDPDELERTRILGSALKERGIHEVIETGVEVWIRDRSRKKGRSPEYILTKVVELDSKNYNEESVYAFVDRYKRSGYTKRKLEVDAEWKELSKMADEILTDTPKFKAVHALSTAALVCDIDLLKAFLRDHLFRNFFKAYPGGKIIIYEKNYGYETRYGIMRSSYALTQYPLSEIKDSVQRVGFATLQQWQRVNSVEQPQLVSELGALSFYPIIPYFMSSPVGLEIFYLFDKREEHELQPFPVSWLDYVSSKWDFGKQEHPFYGILVDPTSPKNEKAVHGRLINNVNFTPDQMVLFIGWLVEKYNELAFHLSDPAEFCDSKTHVIDFILAQEYTLTIDRVFRKSLSCITSQEHIVRTMATMEIADILESLRYIWIKGNPGEWFKRLFNPDEGKKLVLICLENLPEPFKGHFTNITLQVYDELLETVKNSVWIKSKIKSNGIDIKDKTMKTEIEESWPVFTSNVIRALRNTHHGYFTSSDPQLRPSRYLAVINGNIPVSLSYLGVLWGLALLGNPKEMLGWSWLPTGKWD